MGAVVKNLSHFFFQGTYVCANLNQTEELLAAAAALHSEGCMHHGLCAQGQLGLTLVLIRFPNTTSRWEIKAERVSTSLGIQVGVSSDHERGFRAEVVVVMPSLRHTARAVLTTQTFPRTAGEVLTSNIFTHYVTRELHRATRKTVLFLKSYIESVYDNWQRYMGSVLELWEEILKEANGGKIFLVDFYSDVLEDNLKECSPFIASFSPGDEGVRLHRQLTISWTRDADIAGLDSCPVAYEATVAWSETCVLPEWACECLENFVQQDSMTMILYLGLSECANYIVKKGDSLVLYTVDPDDFPLGSVLPVR